MLSFALRRIVGVVPAVLLLAVAAGVTAPNGPAALVRAAAGLPVTLMLVLGALAAGLAAGVPLGLAAGFRPHAVAGRLGRAVGSVGLALPGFLAAALAFLALGAESAMALPVATAALAVPVLAEAARTARSGAADAAEQPFVVAARGRGVPAGRAARRHAVPAALVPVAGALGGLAAATVAGAAAAEALFALPGTGGLLVEAARGGDAGGTLAAAALLAGLVLLLRALGAVLRGALDPRHRVG